MSGAHLAICFFQLCIVHFYYTVLECPRIQIICRLISIIVLSNEVNEITPWLLKSIVRYFKHFYFIAAPFDHIETVFNYTSVCAHTIITYESNYQILLTKHTQSSSKIVEQHP